ncbi:hypothetical protein [Thalassospira lucentensis]|nr:hypothetical protein [Thalassospira lucentensis]
MPERILQVATDMSGQANEKITEIKAVTRATADAGTERLDRGGPGR